MSSSDPLLSDIRHLLATQEIDSAFETEHDLEQGAKIGERDRIRTEFTIWIESLPNPATVHREYFLVQLDRICPHYRIDDERRIDAWPRIVSTT